MKRNLDFVALVLLCAFGLVFMVRVATVAHADPQPALDRQLVERMTRALEEQARATQQLARSVEKCR